MKKFIFLLVFCGTIHAEQISSKNFIVDAPSEAQAREIAKQAELLRSKLAKEWLGKDLEPLVNPCKINYKKGWDRTGFGATTCHNNLPIQIDLSGDYSFVVAYALPHEITHAVIVQRFKSSHPRWVDEGCAVCEEPEISRKKWAKKCLEIRKSGDLYRLASLFDMRDYPNNSTAFYAESYSITQFLVNKGNKRLFLDFVEYGMQNGWNLALKKYYKINTINELEVEWLKTLDEK